MAAIQVMRLAALTQDVAQAMRESLNGEPVHTVATKVISGEWALLRADSPDGTAYAILSKTGDSVCVEAVQGNGGTRLTRALVDAATHAGLRCEAWVFNKARARLSARAGMFLTGASRVSGSGREQLQVST
jgi:hypothetical protein